MKTLFVQEEMAYDGSQLRSHWAAGRTAFEGDALVAFLGPCDVADQHMVDLVDRAAGETIKAARMAHFLAEHFGDDMLKAVLRQRVLLTCARDALDASGVSVERRGSDLYVAGKKLSVSIATVSPVSGVVHLGVNVDPRGAPVEATGLNELGVDEAAFVRDVLARYEKETRSVLSACRKARPVG